MGNPITKSMIVTRTPLRVSLIGGGSDMPDFYTNNGVGSVISLGLEKYIYVVVKRHAKIFNEQYRISYSKTEVVDQLSDIQNNVIRECLRFANIQESLFVSTFSDIPAASGLGSSSALTVGLLNALYAFKGKSVTRHQLAEEACEVEINRMGQPIGKQDQYAAAFGGFHQYDFMSSGAVNVRGISLPDGYLDDVLQHGTLYWTGLTRNVETILTQQKKNFSDGKQREVRAVFDMVEPFRKALSAGASTEKLAKIIDESWALKKAFSDTVSNSAIESYYTKAKEAGAYGGKICGGGGGGFLLLFHPLRLRKAIGDAGGFPFHIPLDLDFAGTELLVSA
jgi:D-glycero-alpha-D-manno-heptose-7-phosphate kinase